MIAIMISVDWPLRAQDKAGGSDAKVSSGNRSTRNRVPHTREASNADREGADRQQPPDDIAGSHRQHGERSEQDRGRRKIQKAVSRGVVDVFAGKPLQRRVSIGRHHRVVAADQDEDVDDQNQRDPTGPSTPECGLAGRNRGLALSRGGLLLVRRGSRFERRIRPAQPPQADLKHFPQHGQRVSPNRKARRFLVDQCHGNSPILEAQMACKKHDFGIEGESVDHGARKNRLAGRRS